MCQARFLLPVEGLFFSSFSHGTGTPIWVQRSEAVLSTIVIRLADMVSAWRKIVSEIVLA